MYGVFSMRGDAGLPWAGGGVAQEGRDACLGYDTRAGVLPLLAGAMAATPSWLEAFSPRQRCRTEAAGRKSALSPRGRSGPRWAYSTAVQQRTAAAATAIY
jgi:hypothetical protein